MLLLHPGRRLDLQQVKRAVYIAAEDVAADADSLEGEGPLKEGGNRNIGKGLGCGCHCLLVAVVALLNEPSARKELASQGPYPVARVKERLLADIRFLGQLRLVHFQVQALQALKPRAEPGF
jgi:hypothetical protein